MKRMMFLLVISCCFNSLPFAEEVNLDVPYYWQSDAGWCWAASGSMLAKYHNGDSTKTKPWWFAAYHGKGKDEGGNILEVKEVLSVVNPLIDYDMEVLLYPGTSIAEARIKALLRSGRPIYLKMESPDHAMVLTGFNDDYIFVNEPSGAAFPNNPSVHSKVSWGTFWDKVDTWNPIDDPAIVSCDCSTHSATSNVSFDLCPAPCPLGSQTIHKPGIISEFDDTDKLWLEWSGAIDRPGYYYFSQYGLRKSCFGPFPNYEFYVIYQDVLKLYPFMSCYDSVDKTVRFDVSVTNNGQNVWSREQTEVAISAYSHKYDELVKAIPVSDFYNDLTTEECTLRVICYDAATNVEQDRVELGFKVDLSQPGLGNGSVSPDSGDSQETFSFSVYYLDRTGSSPSSAKVYINDTGYTMTRASGSSANGTYRYQIASLADGNYNYYFKFTNSKGDVVRLPQSGTLSGPVVTAGGTTPDSETKTLTASVTDMIISSYPNNPQLGGSLNIYNNTSIGGYKSTGFVKFNLSNIPEGSTIDSVSLQMYCASDGANGKVDIGQSTKDWNTSVTWNSYYSTGTAWKVLAERTDRGSENAWWTWSSSTYPQIKNTVQDWIDGTDHNYGFLILPGYMASVDPAYGSTVWFYGVNTTNPSLVPKLIINYTPPPKSDLIITKVSPDPTSNTFTVGQSVDWHVKVKNNSGGPADESVVGYYLGASSNDLSNRINSDTTSALDVGDSEEDHDSYIFTKSDVGVHYVICKADDDEDIDESKENNNTNWYGPFNVVPATFALITSVTGGQGSLTSGANYESGTVVPLTANPAIGYRIKSWSGTNNDSTTANSNTVTMTSTKTVTVEFEKITYMLTTSVSGQGTVSPSSADRYDYGTVVSLLATPASGYTVKSWSGTDDDGSKAIHNTVTITSDKVVTIEFKAFDNNPDTYTESAKADLLTGTISGIKSAFATLEQGMANGSTQTDPELIFLHVLSRLGMLVFDTDNAAVDTSVVEMLEPFGVTITGDSLVDGVAQLPVDGDGNLDLPATADPDAAILAIRNSIVPEIESILTEIDTIPSSWAGMTVGPQDLDLLTAAVELDYSEVLMLKAGLLGVKAMMVGGLDPAYDLFVDLASPMFNGWESGELPLTTTVQSVLDAYPTLLEIMPDTGVARLGTFKQNLLAALNAFTSALDSIIAETDNQADDALQIDGSDASYLGLRAELDKLVNSLTSGTSATYPLQVVHTYTLNKGSNIGKLIVEFSPILMEFSSGKLFITDLDRSGLPTGIWTVSNFSEENGVISGEVETDYSGGYWYLGYMEGTLTGDQITSLTISGWGNMPVSPYWLNFDVSLTGQLESNETRTVTYNPGPVLAGTVSPRDMLPSFDADSTPVPGTMGAGLNNDATLGGVFPGMTQNDWMPQGYDVWGGNTDFSILPRGWEYYYDIDQFGYILLGSSNGGTAAFSGQFNYYVIAAKGQFLLDSVMWQSGTYSSGSSTTGNTLDWQNLAGARDDQYATVGYQETEATYRGYVVMQNPGNETGLTVITDKGSEITYTLTINNGTGDGDYSEGAVQTITADAAPSGKQFDLWTGDTSSVGNIHAATTTVTMPASDVTVTATYTTVAVSGTRDLPYGYQAGANLTVKLNLEVDEAGKPNGVIVKDYVPAGWIVTSAIPNYSGWEPSTGEIRWVFTGPLVSDTGMDISYAVTVPQGEGGVKTFSGEILYNNPTSGDPVTVDFSGDTQVDEATAHPGDKDGDMAVGDFELLDYIDRWAAGHVGDFELLDCIDLWAAGHYYWDAANSKFKPGYE